MILWTTTTDNGEADTRELAATEAIDSVLAYWGRQHPRTGGAELVTICVDNTEAYAGLAIDLDGTYDQASTTTALQQLRDHLALDPR